MNILRSQASKNRSTPSGGWSSSSCLSAKTHPNLGKNGPDFATFRESRSLFSVDATTACTAGSLLTKGVWALHDEHSHERQPLDTDTFFSAEPADVIMC